MSYIEDNKQKRASNFRTGMDIGMGLFYISIGTILIYAKSFGSNEVPAWAAYLLGSMMVIGGGFRFYRGIEKYLPKKKDEEDEFQSGN